MEKLTWSDVGSTLHDFVYLHTELAIWIGLALVVVILFWWMVYSIGFRRFMAVLLLCAALAVCALYYFGILDVTSLQR